jgi:capsular exopolysaccharide synthesis family protein
MQASGSSADDAIDLREYVAVLRRRIWLILVILIFFTGLAGSYSFTRTPMYTALAEVLIQPTTASSQFRPDQLVSLDTETRLAKSAPVAEIAKETLRSPLSIPQLLKKVGVTTLQDALVLDISYTDGNAKASAAGADAFANAYLEYKRDRAVDAATTARQGIEHEINELLSQRDKLDRQVAQAVPGSAEDLNAQEERDTVNGQIAVLTSQIAALPVVVDAGEVIIEPEVPIAPSSPKHVMNLAMGLFLGGFFGIVAAFIRDRTDERIAGRADLEATLDAPVLAAIPTITGMGKRGPVGLVTEKQPRSPAAEAYRTLRTGVMAMGRQRGLKVFAVASPTLGDGKSTTVANLAVVLSHADNRILAISADLRRPTLHTFFEVENGLGLGDVLLGDVPIKEAILSVSPNLWLLTSGRPPARPAELLQSRQMSDLLAQQSELFDYVLVDCPPVLGLADTLAIAPFVDAVLLVASAESTTRGALMHAAEQLGQVGAVVRGAVLNNVAPSKRGGMDGFGYTYGYGYGASPEDEELDDRRTPPSTQRERTRDRSGNGGRKDGGDAPARRADVGNGAVVTPGSQWESGVRNDPRGRGTPV